MLLKPHLKSWYKLDGFLGSSCLPSWECPHLSSPALHPVQSVLKAHFRTQLLWS